MADSRAPRTCVRCHDKKIKCSGFPGCRNCTQASSSCQKYIRPRKSDTLRALQDARKRVQWLEAELEKDLDLDCRSIPTGTALKLSGRRFSAASAENSATPTSAPVPSSAPAEAPPADEPSEISLVALNATGELKYLGPSSGALFANLAKTLIRSCSSAGATGGNATSHSSVTEVDAGALLQPGAERQLLSENEIQLLVTSYKMWIHPLYPLLSHQTLENLASRYPGITLRDTAGSGLGHEHGHDMAMFYVVLALGAMNRDNTLQQLGLEDQRSNGSDNPSPALLYALGMRYFDSSVEKLASSVSFLRVILLICIYSSYGPIGSSQWQLAGLAMRTAVELGLHCAPRSRQASSMEANDLQRVFWTCYTIELTLAYNLGRPPSIGDEHITAQLPLGFDEDAWGIHHIKHRRIQSQIISQVYCVSGSVTKPERDRQAIITSLQSQLDAWRDSIPTPPTTSRTASAYPMKYWDRLYHSSTFVLHRSSPLFPRPSGPSLEACVRNAGAYIDDMAEVLRGSNVPLSWMLIQGVLFAGLTMLVTARTGLQNLVSRAGFPLLLVDLPRWARTCSVCLAVINERWKEGLLKKLEGQFEMLANDTLSVVCARLDPGSSMENEQSRMEGLTASVAPVVATDGASRRESLPLDDMEDPAQQGVNAGGVSESFDVFHEVLGLDVTQTFWDVFGLESENDLFLPL